MQNIKTLMFDSVICGIFYKSLIMFSVTFSLFYLVIFTVSKSPGSFGVTFVYMGIGFGIGNVGSGFLVRVFEDYVVYIGGLVVIFALNLIQTFPQF